MDETIKKKVAEHWSNKAKSQSGAVLRLRWWQSPFIIRHINMRVCGHKLDGFSQGLIHRAKQILDGHPPLRKGISVGGGSGSKELSLLKQGLVESFDLFEYSEKRIADGEAAAARMGLSERIRFIQGDAFEHITAVEQYDLVHWNNSLHHMFDVDQAVAWSRQILSPGGLFYMDDFVGPTRFQWSDMALKIASDARLLLDRRFLVNPRKPGTYLPTEILRPNVDNLKAADPSEAADSGRIIDSVRRHFPDAEIVATGGVIYHLALSDVLHNFDEERDRTILELLMFIDDLCANLIETHYATALALKY